LLKKEKTLKKRTQVARYFILLVTINKGLDGKNNGGIRVDTMHAKR
jgi:hypothetical protein